jgi:outer membrane receptor protein involved in Fe transport
MTVLGGVGTAALAMAMQAGAVGTAWAQDAASVDQVVVTASRVARSGFTAPTPVTTIGEDQLETRAPTTMGEVLAGIPSFRPSSSPQTAGVTSRTGGVISADLRGLGSDRTLVLVNGRRFVPQTPSGTVDMKQIPTLLVQNVEVVTGGASAAWGSDAVAGVVNFILKDRIEGIQGTVQYGQSEVNDNIEYRASLATGGTLGDGRLRAVIGADYLLNLGISSQYTRDWGREEVGIHTNTAFATNGLPQYIIAPNSGITNMTQGGLIVSGPLRGTAFLPNGGTYRYQFGQEFGTTMIGGSKDGQNPNLDSNLGQPIESLSGLTHLDFDLNESISLFAEGSYSWTRTKGASQEPRDRGNLVIQRDNAYLPESVRQQMVALNLNTITIGRSSEDTGAIKLLGETKTLRAVVGAKGKLFGTWTWDTYYQYGRDDYHLDFGPNNRNQANFFRAVDAVRSPGGQIVCRSTLTTPGNGCIPVNVFGDGSLTLNDYVNGTATVDQLIEQHVAAFNVQGELFSTWAGPVSLATGVEYRKDSVDAPTDAVSQQLQPNGSVGGWILGNQLPLKGSINVKEIYGETVVPLSEAGTALGALDINAAVRRTDYSISGGVTTWKIGGTWEPVDDIRIRMTRSRDIRAPNLSEFYQAGGSSNTNVFDPVAGGQVQVREIAQGNLNLVPERANTFTGGFVLQPRWIPRLAVSVDYFNIEVDDVIGSIGAPVAVQGCQAGDPVFCQSVVYNSNGTIAYVIAQQLNLDQLRTSGIDYEVQYSLPAFGGLFQFRGLMTQTKELVTVQQNGPVERLGRMSAHLRVTGVPKWRGNVDLRYSHGPWSTNLQVRYIGKGLFNPDLTEGGGRANTVNDNTVPAFVYFNLGAQYNFEVLGKSLELYGVVNNLLDTDPPWLPSGAAGGTNETSSNAAQGYDLIGRNYRVGLRFRF